MKRILILGGGIGGLVAANKLRKKLGKEHKIILIDKNKTRSNKIKAPFLYLNFPPNRLFDDILFYNILTNQ